MCRVAADLSIRSPNGGGPLSCEIIDLQTIAPWCPPLSAPAPEPRPFTTTVAPLHRRRRSRSGSPPPARPSATRADRAVCMAQGSRGGGGVSREDWPAYRRSRGLSHRRFRCVTCRVRLVVEWGVAHSTVVPLAFPDSFGALQQKKRLSPQTLPSYFSLRLARIPLVFLAYSPNMPWLAWSCCSGAQELDWLQGRS